jgi:hypothetical protein
MGGRQFRRFVLVRHGIQTTLVSFLIEPSSPVSVVQSVMSQLPSQSSPEKDSTSS